MSIPLNPADPAHRILAESFGYHPVLCAWCLKLSHVEYARRHPPTTPCAAWHVTFGGQCLNCGHRQGTRTIVGYAEVAESHAICAACLKVQLTSIYAED